MGRRKSKLSKFSIFHWFCSNIAVVLGLIPQPQRNTRRLSIRRCNHNKNIKMYTKQKCLQLKEIDRHHEMNSRTNAEFNNVSRSANLSKSTILNDNNNRSFDNLTYDDMNINRSSNDNQRQILCILVENKKLIEYIPNFLKKHASIFKDSRIIDLQKLVKFIQSSSTNITSEDIWSMINTEQIEHQTTSCDSFNTQSDNTRRLKALEFIRLFIEKNKEDFCKYLLNEEHLCQQKTLAIYQMIEQFLKIIYQSEYEQKLKNIVN